MIEQCEKQKRKTNVFSTYEASLYILNHNNNNKKDFYSDILIYFLTMRLSLTTFLTYQYYLLLQFLIDIDIFQLYYSTNINI